MRRLMQNGLILLLAVNIAGWAVLGFHRTREASAQAPLAPTSPPRQPFANSVEQRIETVKHLQEIANLLREQNELLRSGDLRVVVRLDPSEAKKP